MHSTRCLDSCQGRKEEEFFLKNDIRPTHKQKRGRGGRGIGNMGKQRRNDYKRVIPTTTAGYREGILVSYLI